MDDQQQRAVDNIMEDLKGFTKAEAEDIIKEVLMTKCLKKVWSVKNMTELTMEKLKEMKPGEVIATGSGTYPEVTDIQVKWVAVRGGGYHDWAIYCHSIDKSEEYIRTQGNKMFTKSVIKRLVPCNDEAYGLYRF